MVYLHCCSIHNKPQDKVCAMHPCCQVACEDCLLLHQRQTDHHLAICLNQNTLNYFTLFTQYIHQLMLRCTQDVQNNTFQAVFRLQPEEGSLWQTQPIKGQVSNIAIRILEQHRQLMLSNKNYVQTNKDSKLLYHPECIRDIYNLIVHPWEVNAHIILLKFTTVLQQTFPGLCQEHFPVISIRQHLLIQIQNHRIQLLAQWKDQLIIDLKPTQHINKRDSSGQIDTNGSQSNEISSPLQQDEISQFHVAQQQVLNIKVIDSYQHIEPQQPYQHFSQLQRQNTLLLAQNNSLKIQNMTLKEDNSILKDKCDKMQVERRQIPSSNKKRKDSELNSELLSEIVQLQCELSDNRHDLQILIAYLNELSLRKAINAKQLHQKLLPLRTITLR